MRIRWWRGLSLLAAVSALTACGGHKATRPGSEPGPEPAGAAAAPQGTTHHGWFHRGDDTSLPQDRRYGDSSDSSPTGAPPSYIYSLPEPVPKAEPRSLYGNKSPYSVLGQTYSVLPSASGYDERGIASFYGNKFHGYKTSSLEDYDMYKFTAASKVLPLPSYARVTNLSNGKSVIVRINDRGPFHENRIIDLSYAAAVRIGIWPKGTGLVEVQGIDPSAPDREPPPPAPVTTHGGSPGIYLQVGAFSDPANAERVAAQLRQANFAPVQVEQVQINDRTIHRVRVGPLDSVDRADTVTDRIEGMGLPRPKVAVN
ncbi:septal ring lytic transglycosylase RlpA family protein [Rhodanobacter sp. DHG33]|uniref:septal ring lytic transglycosylase RlpA family protein n=1 Tax=Rhodanobacter sp. DHG33 TaxID=2775921 RepID=UPI00177F7020|nr:septal ring lytic transglycosylase RlpA family protein [Rhodanobacter sp. DHG33]MBD8899075.1 septal ring lytic transglycosylase RlpA family protein [Rhodanobacter sp. DHG33]